MMHEMNRTNNTTETGRINAFGRRIFAVLLAFVMMFGSAVPTFAATDATSESVSKSASSSSGKYGEDKPLTSVSVEYLTVHGHKHKYIEADNGYRYMLYCSKCLDGIEGTLVSNHASTVTIDGVKYTFRDYSSRVGGFINVIKPVKTATKAKTVALKSISLNKSSLSLIEGGTYTLSVKYNPTNTTVDKIVTWKSSNTKVATVSGGKIRTYRAGTATITATCNGKTATCKVTVKANTTSGNGSKTTSVGKSTAAKDVTFTFPKTMTMTVGESKTVELKANPSNTKALVNIGWGLQHNGDGITQNIYGFGSYWNQPAKVKYTAKRAGTYYVTAYVKVFDKKGGEIIKTESYKCVVTVKAKASGKTATKATSKATTNTATKSASKTTTATKTTTKNTTKAKTVALKGISLSKSSLSLTVGGSSTLSVKYNPTNTTASKNVTWKSSNTKVATVSGGKITAKKAGTATITATCNGKTATCKVTVKANTASKTTTTSKNTSTSKNTTASKNTSTSKTKTVSGPNSSTPKSTATSKSAGGTYRDVSDTYTIVNKFRTTKSNQWYWNYDNKTKTYTYGLKALKRDAELENAAKVRAREAWERWFIVGGTGHIRPDNTDWYEAFPKNMHPFGENLAYWSPDGEAAVAAWAETYDKYEGQGHRRNMLTDSATKIGLACYTKDGKTCWAMCLAY